jgi:hypothetical protein
MAFWSTQNFVTNLQTILPREYESFLKNRIRESSLELSLGEEAFISSQQNG